MDLIKQHALSNLFETEIYRCDKNGVVISNKGIIAKIITASILPNGYYQDSFSVGFQKSIKVYRHIAVWIYFKGVYNPIFEIDHIDRDLNNNTLLNLRCVTKEVNKTNMVMSTGNKIPPHKFSKRGFREVPLYIKDEIIKDYNGGGVSKNQLSKKYDISRQTIYKILK